MEQDANAIPGYTYGSAAIPASPVSIEELARTYMMASVGVSQW